MEIEIAPTTQLTIEVLDPSHAGEARRSIVEYAASLDMDETECGKIAIVVTEMATNLVKHAGHGKILCGPVSDGKVQGLRVLSLDKGPGIQDVGAALEDGYSTYGSSGNGLGAARRLCTEFDLYSWPGAGTCVLAEFLPHKQPKSIRAFKFGVVSLPVRGETVSGDGWGVLGQAGRSSFMVVDGLGHGPLAAEAAREAERVLGISCSSSAGGVLQDFHDALKKTRGAAAAIAEINRENGTLTFAGIGNISATVIEGHRRRGLASHNGIVGHQMHRIQEFGTPWNEGSVLIMHSDGLGSKWDMNQYPGLASKHPSIIAAILYRDFQRERDDVTVMVVKNHQ